MPAFLFFEALIKKEKKCNQITDISIIADQSNHDN